MGGDVITKVLVLMAGLIALGASASPLLFDPAVEEAEDEQVLATPPTPAVRDDAVGNDAVRNDAVIVNETAAIAGGNAVAVEGDAVGTETVVVTDPVAADPLAADPVAADPLAADPVAADAAVVADPLVVAPLAGDPEPTVVPFFVTIPLLIAALVLTIWAMLTPAARLGRPALICGVIVLLGTAIAWGLYAAGVSEIEMTGTPLAAWLCVGFTLIAAWLVTDVLASPAEDDAVPG